MREVDRRFEVNDQSGFLQGRIVLQYAETIKERQIVVIVNADAKAGTGLVPTRGLHWSTLLGEYYAYAPAGKPGDTVSVPISYGTPASSLNISFAQWPKVQPVPAATFSGVYLETHGEIPAMNQRPMRVTRILIPEDGEQ